MLIQYLTGSSEKIYLRTNFLLTIVRSMVICAISLAEITGSLLILQLGNNKSYAEREHQAISETLN